MRIVVFSDLHPPLFVGGYEIGAASVAEELRRRGHDVLLLTARELITQTATGFRHARQPDLPSFVDAGPCLLGSLPRFLFTHPIRSLMRAGSLLLARRRYRKAIAEFRPERVLLFNPLGIVSPVLHDLTELAHDAGAEVHAYVSDDWLAEWPTAHPLLRPLSRLRESDHGPIRLLGRVLTSLVERAGWTAEALPHIDRFFYCSDHVRRVSLRRAWQATSHSVVPWGLAGVEHLPPLDPDHFLCDAPLTFLYAGQILEHKGLDLLLRAVAKCQQAHHVVVLGDDTTPYAAACKRRITELDLTQHIHFLGRKPHAETATMMGRLGHVLVVPSVWDEPLSITMLEGMALGLPVIASATGGTPEAIRHKVNGLLFERNSVEQLTVLLDRLAVDRDLCLSLSRQARRTIREHFTIEKMVDRLLGKTTTLRRAA